MQKFSLEALARELSGRAAAAGGQHTAQTVVDGHERVLRQTVIAMIGGSILAEHESPGESTVHVLSGRVRLSAGDVSWIGRDGDLLVIPESRHSLEALETLLCCSPSRRRPRVRPRAISCGRRAAWASEVSQSCSCGLARGCSDSAGAACSGLWRLRPESVLGDERHEPSVGGACQL